MEYGTVKRSHCLPDFAVLLDIDEVADPVPHLALGLFYEESFAHTHKGGAGLGGDGFNVASNESVVGGGGDDGSHIQKAL